MNATTIDLPDTECALVTSDNMEGLSFKFPNPEHQDLGNYKVPELMACLAACYYRYFADPEFGARSTSRTPSAATSRTASPRVTMTTTATATAMFGQLPDLG
jgi:hypothetical protein